MGALAAILEEHLAGPELPPAQAAVWPLAVAEGQAHGIDPRLIMAVIEQESGFDPRATHVEPDGRVSRGLMQLLEDTARGLMPGLDPQALYDPALNVRLGTRYLGQQLARYGGNAAAAVAAYNAGSAYVDAQGRFVSKGGTITVQPYVDRVLGAFARYQTGLVGAAGEIPLAAWLVAGAGVVLVGGLLLVRARRRRW